MFRESYDHLKLFSLNLIIWEADYQRWYFNFLVPFDYFLLHKSGFQEQEHLNVAWSFALEDHSLELNMACMIDCLHFRIFVLKASVSVTASWAAQIH